MHLKDIVDTTPVHLSFTSGSRPTAQRVRKVARAGAIAALTASTPGRRRKSAPEASEVAKLTAEVDRLGGAIIEQAIELAALRGTTSWG